MKYVRIGGETRKEVMSHIGMAFQSYFEGVEHACDPVENIPISKFGIRYIDVHWTGTKGKEKYVITLQLVHPGIFIGKRGSLIEAFSSYLSRHLNGDVNFNLIECSNIITEITHNKKLKVIPQEIDWKLR